MKALKIKIGLLGLLLLAGGLGAKSVRKDNSAYHARVEAFFASIMEIKVETAYDNLFDNAKMPQKREIVDKLKSQTARMLATLGSPIGYEAVREQRYGESVVRVVYILKYDSGPIIWEFYFYKPKAEWILINLEPSDRLGVLADK